jgi:hypothetical protein
MEEFKTEANFISLSQTPQNTSYEQFGMPI